VEIKVIDDFLSLDKVEELEQMIIHNTKFPWFYQEQVTFKNEDLNETQPWNWYQTHKFYEDDKVNSPYYNKIRDIFFPHFNDLQSLIRIKANFYPHTETLREHLPHSDYNFSHRAAIFSLNTCDGFTRMKDGTKIDSVKNRIIFFDGHTSHNSSTTTTSPVRWNLNFNYLSITDSLNLKQRVGFSDY
tara:strand:+ start:100 stop:660 length:561 start_codon:yes stop_codon:yes gene_type:complete